MKDFQYLTQLQAAKVSLFLEQSIQAAQEIRTPLLLEVVLNTENPYSFKVNQWDLAWPFGLSKPAWPLTPTSPLQSRNNTP